MSRGKKDRYSPLVQAVYDYLFKVRYYDNHHHSLDMVLLVSVYDKELVDMIHYVFCRYSENAAEFVEEEPGVLAQLGDAEKYRVIFNDFLTLNTQIQYDLIILSPPAGKELDYLQKARDIMALGGQVICITNPSAMAGVVSQWCQKHSAKIEYPLEDMALILVDFPRELPPSLIMEHYQQNIWSARQKAGFDQLAESDVFAAIVQQYDNEIATGKRLILEAAALSSGLNESFEDSQSHRPIMVLSENTYRSVKEISVNTFIRKVRYKYWEALFQLRRFSDYFTVSLLDEYRENIEKLADYDFNLYHIRPIYSNMVARMRQSISDAILDLFDEFSQKHTWYQECEKNVHYYTGWATNKAWYIGKKVIIPLSCKTYYDNSFDVSKAREKLQEIERVFHFLDNGITMAEIDLRKTLEQAKKQGQQKNIELKYFSVTLYKKGTCHITFKDMDLVKKLNIFGGQRKGWLPPSYGKKPYADMSKEEQAVIDEFEGEAAYASVMARADYFLQETTIPLLTDGFRPNEESKQT